MPPTSLPTRSYAYGNDGLRTTSGAVLLARVLLRRKVDKGDVAKSSSGRKSKTKQNTEKALPTVWTYWLFLLDLWMACCIRSSPRTVNNLQLSSLFHTTPAIERFHHMRKVTELIDLHTRRPFWRTRDDGCVCV